MRSQNSSIIDRFLGLIENNKPSDTIVLRCLFFITIISGLVYFTTLSGMFTEKTPGHGGTLVEGIIGIPRFVNPVLAITRTDQDVVALLYKGLMKIDEAGNLVPDIAESIILDEEKKTYAITLKKGISFHDGTPLTTKDVIFTINLMRDPNLKSPLRGNWNDVAIEEISEYEMRISLLEPYTPFIENFTFGIMPYHIWNNVPIEQLPFSQYNTEPIGSGAFKIKQVDRDTSGLISGYTLIPAETKGDRPNFNSIELKFYQNEDQLTDALQTKEIQSTVFLPNNQIAALPSDEYTVSTIPLPRVFGIFFNQNRSAVLRDKSARNALSAAINREELLEKILQDQGVPTALPIILEHLTVSLENTGQESTSTSSLELARSILEGGGWKQTESGQWQKRLGQETETLSLTIRTGNSSLFDATATAVADTWRELGVDVEIEQYEQTGLVQSVIRSRDFQALLFGLDMNRSQDLYPFWHSSQKDDPGLNVAQYTNISVDTLLEEARNTSDSETQLRLTKEISDIITTETPAVFLYAPSITYVIDKEITSAPMTRLGKPSDRFMNIENWHASTDVVWPIFK
jgi:peptide/nickel transport system substrate-binding protein